MLQIYIYVYDFNQRYKPQNNYTIYMCLTHVTNYIQWLKIPYRSFPSYFLTFFLLFQHCLKKMGPNL